MNADFSPSSVSPNNIVSLRSSSSPSQLQDPPSQRSISPPPGLHRSHAPSPSFPLVQDYLDQEEWLSQGIATQSSANSSPQHNDSQTQVSPSPAGSESEVKSLDPHPFPFFPQ